MKHSGDFFTFFLGSEAIVATAAAKMRDLGMTPEDVLHQYDEWMAEQMAGMIPAPEPAQDNAPGDVRQPAGQADREFRLGACPKCGAEVWGIKKCPHISPPWQTFFACDGENCNYHGKSRLTIEVLRRRWPEGVEVD